MLRMKGGDLFNTYDIGKINFKYSTGPSTSAVYPVTEMINRWVYPLPDNWGNL
jgi:hypothetical protein